MDRETFPARKSVPPPISGRFRGPGGSAGGADWGSGLREGDPFMLHVTCDLCGKELCPGHDHRYVVKMEVFAAHDPAKITEADLDDDHMEAVSELIREMEDHPEQSELVETYKHLRYDLCPECH